MYTREDKSSEIKVIHPHIVTSGQTKHSDWLPTTHRSIFLHIARRAVVILSELSRQVLLYNENLQALQNFFYVCALLLQSEVCGTLLIWTPNETEESVLISEVSYFLGVKLRAFDRKEKVSLLV